MYADGAQRTQPLSFGGDLRAGTCFVDRNGPFGVYSVFICTYNGFNSAYHADAFHTESAVHCFLNALGLHPIGQTNLSEWLGTLISQGTGIIAKESMAFAAKAGQFVFSFVIAYYLLCERKQLGRHLLCCFPLRGGRFFICLFGLQKRVDELPVRRAENQLIRLSGNIRRPFRAWNQ
ncbi:MAG: hypothetical protein ACLR07_02390 [Christensenellales bacterium]